MSLPAHGFHQVSLQNLGKEVDWRHLQSWKLVLHPALLKAGKMPHFYVSREGGLQISFQDELIRSDNWKGSK